MLYNLNNCFSYFESIITRSTEQITVLDDLSIWLITWEAALWCCHTVPVYCVWQMSSN